MSKIYNTRPELITPGSFFFEPNKDYNLENIENSLLVPANITIISASSDSFRKADWISGISFFLYAKYSVALMLPITSPFTMTWDPTLSVGFKRIGFMHTFGAIPAASACITWARPISSPSSVINEFKAIFWDLNGATLYPSCLKIRSSPATMKLFPTPDMVPCTMITLDI